MRVVVHHLRVFGPEFLQQLIDRSGLVKWLHRLRGKGHDYKEREDKN